MRAAIFLLCPYLGPAQMGGLTSCLVDILRSPPIHFGWLWRWLPISGFPGPSEHLSSRNAPWGAATHHLSLRQTPQDLGKGRASRISFMAKWNFFENWTGTLLPSLGSHRWFWRHHCGVSNRCPKDRQDPPPPHYQSRSSPGYWSGWTLRTLFGWFFRILVQVTDKGFSWR